LGISISQASSVPDSVNVSNTEAKSYRAQILVQDGKIYSVWTDKSPGNADIFFSRSIDGGLSFESSINLSENEGSSAFPRIAVSGNNVYSTWYDYTPGYGDIFFSKSSDEGKSFETINLSENTGDSYNPWISATGDYVYVVWNDGTHETSNLEIEKPDEIPLDIGLGNLEIFLAVSNDAGKTFETINLSNIFESSWNARMRISENNVYVVWNQKTSAPSDIFFSMSSNNGMTFSDPINVSNSEVDSRDAGIEISGNNVYVVWKEKNPDNEEIFFSKSSDNGSSFGYPRNLSQSIGQSKITRDAQIAISGENVFVVWYDEGMDNQIFFIKSDDQGESFLAPILLREGTTKSEFAQIAIIGSEVYVIWNDYTHGSADVFLRHSSDYGASFGSVKNLSDDPTDSLIFFLGPQISASKEGVFTIFEKNTGNDDLFLKQISQMSNTPYEGMTLETSNKAVSIVLGINHEKIEISQPTEFSLRFSDPKTGTQLEDVNYSLIIEDTSGTVILEILDHYSPTGLDSHEISFENSGPVTIHVQVLGTGESNIDTKYSGNTSAVITVVPEFPMAILGFVAVGMVMALAIQKINAKKLGL